MSGWLRVAVLWTLAAGVACSRPTPLQQMLDGLEDAVEDRSAEAVAEYLAADLQAQNGMSRPMALAELKRYFFAYQSLDVSFSEVQPEGEPPSKVSVRVDMSGKAKQIGGLAGMLPELAAYRFDLDLASKDGRLLVSGARWERVDRVGQ